MLKYRICESIKNWKQLINKYFIILGVVTLIYNVIIMFFSSSISTFDFGLSSLILFLVVVLLFALLLNMPKTKYVYFLKNRDIKITLVIGDMFSQSGAKVIPTNTTFDTTFEKEFISAKSVQGQLQDKYFKNNINVLDEFLKAGLKSNPVVEKLNDRKTKRNRYEVGTVVKIKIPNEDRWYFLAIADVNEYGKPAATYHNILNSLQSLWYFLFENGHMENLIIPIIGTGRTGIAEATRIRVLKEIVISFVAISTEKKITDNLIICIHPNDFINNDINLSELTEYLNYVCKYKYDSIDTKKIGKAEE